MTTKYVAVIISFAAMLPIPSAADVITPPSMADSVQALVKRLTPRALSSLQKLEEALHVQLSEGQGTDSFASWISGPSLVQGVNTKGIEYRTPRANGSATEGPIIIVEIDPEPCVLLPEIRATQPNLQWGGAPSSHASDPDIYWAKHQADATLSYGFRAFGYECLRKIVYSLKHPSFR